MKKRKPSILSPRLFSLDHELDIKSANLHQMQLSRIPKVEVLSAREILALRRNLNATREVMARLLNVHVSSIQNWEEGSNKPDGHGMKLLNVLKKRGIKALL